ncbi:class 1 fructose-bisphosphatase [Roseibium sp.]|uniref:class 1 fructose-bisphosphatase n=1 Tax=Roseibium sp. TaxID=1936156 RepID=UPI003D10DE96
MTQEHPVLPTDGIPDLLQPVLTALSNVARDLSKTIAKGELAGSLGAAVGGTAHGDDQKALDVIADDAFSSALKGTGVRWYASEEQEHAVALDDDASLALAIDPLDGSSNIDVNVSIGTIFSVFPAEDDAQGSFLRPAREQIAAGYFIYGPQTALILTVGDGVRSYTLDPDTGRFHLTNASVTIPPVSTEFAINASNYRHWPKPVRAYIDDCLAGTDGPRAQNFNMRWIASLVAETHRILSRGGIFLYPSDDREGYRDGRLRLIYECAPIAFLVEQAGGKATTGSDPILGLTAKALHARTPMIFGSAEKVERVAAYYDLPEQETSALFGQRGLFRA